MDTLSDVLLGLLLAVMAVAGGMAAVQLARGLFDGRPRCLSCGCPLDDDEALAGYCGPCLDVT